jgi:hypothetical protein
MLEVTYQEKCVIHKFWGGGDRNEFEFLKFIAKASRKLEELLVLTKEISASEDQVAAVNRQLALRACTYMDMGH